MIPHNGLLAARRRAPLRLTEREAKLHPPADSLRNLLVAFGAVLALSACQTTGRKAVLDEMDQTLSQAAARPAAAAVPAEVANALIPSIELAPVEAPQVADKQRFDISVEEVPARQFFMGLVQGTDFNMVVHPEVRGNITVNLRDVTIPDVMEAVRDVYGFEFVQTGYGFQVLPGRLQARIYQINFLNVLRSGSSSSFVSSGTLTGGASSGVSAGTGADGAGLDTGAASGEARSVIGTQISTLQPETAFWEELQTSINAIVGGGEGRSVVVNPQSGVVVVRALPNELREVEVFLRATQLIVQRQVILEAKILEVELNDRYQAGINWAGLLNLGSTRTTVGQTGGGSVLVNEGNTSDINGQTGNLGPTAFNAIQGNLASAFGGVFTLAFGSGDFNAFIELLKLQGNVQVLSSPRISTLNNQKAIIKVGTDEFFVTDVSTTTTTGVTTTSSPSVELTPFFSGIALDVTPQISEAGYVTLHVHPSVSQVVDQQKTITVGGQTQTIPLARSTVRETDSIVRALNGQVVVVGGLMINRIDDDEARSPGLSDIPGVGSLFRQRLERTVKSELVILLRPIVVSSNEQWTDAIRGSSGAMDALRGELIRRDTPPAFDP